MTTTNLPDLIALARAAGAAGMSYTAWASTEAVFDAVQAYDTAGVPFDTTSYEAAFAEGRRSYRLSGGWRLLWTTAPADYDTFGTETVEVIGPWHGKTLRSVVIDPVHVDYQEGRYSSGLHRTWNEDPRLEEARREAALEREREEAILAEQKRAAGFVWLRDIDDAFLEGDPDAVDAELRARGLLWTDRTAELRRRHEQRAAEDRAATWERCRAAFSDGATLIDVGRPPERTAFGWSKGRSSRAWRNVMVKQSYRCSDDATLAEVVGEGGEVVGSLDMIAERLERGEYRLARPDEHIAPLAVVRRLGCSFTEIMRAEVGGRVAWVGRPSDGLNILVLDDHGHLVRKAEVRSGAESVFLDREFRGCP